MKTHFNPFLDPAPSEVPLPDSPLVRVIVQVRFPARLELVERPTVSAIQKAIGRDFPVLDEQNLKTFLFELAPGESEGKIKPQASPEPQWRFSHPDTGFVLQINSTSITLETGHYTSRTDFFAKFQSCIEAIHREIPIPLVTRLGVRYVDRVPDSRCKDIHTMICTPYQGISGLPFEVPVLADMHDFMVKLEHENALLHARTGFLPVGATIDPAILDPLAERCWVLDLDLFRQAPPMISFNPEALAADASVFALRIYTVFRWLINKEFLKTFGGKV